MSARHDWKAFTAHVNQYLDSLDPFHQPMEKTAFGQAFGVPAGTFHDYARRCPESHVAQLMRRYNQARDQWAQRLASYLVNAKQFGRTQREVAEQWGMTPEQVHYIARTLRRRGLMPESSRGRPLSVKEVFAVLREGMSRHELAQVLGVRVSTIHNLLRSDRRSELAVALQERVKWSRQGAATPWRVVSIGRKA